MVNRVQSNQYIVRNPLTVIAVFAGLAEITATIALPSLNADVQRVFVWFVMAFPLVLVILFFLVLWFKHHVLYALSDFSDESNFMRHWGPVSTRELDQEQNIVADEAELNAKSSSGGVESYENPAHSSDTPPSRFRSALAEKYAMAEVSRRLGLNFTRDVQFSGRLRYRYDGVAISKEGPVMVEVKYLRHPSNALLVLRREIERAAAISLELPSSELNGARLILAFVTDTKEIIDSSRGVQDRMRKEIRAANLPIAIDFEFFALESMQGDYLA